jgi:hypothetical protein
MAHHWYNISYPNSEEFRFTDEWFELWKNLMCKRGYHCFDEMVSSEDWGVAHSLVCDACGLQIIIDEERTKEVNHIHDETN